MGHAVFIDKADGDDVVTLAQQACRDVVATWRILVVGASYLLAVDIGDICIKERSQQQTGRLSGMGLVNLDVLTQPSGTRSAPAPVVLVDNVPRGVIAVVDGKTASNTRILSI